MTVPGGSLTAPPRMRTFQTIKQQLQQQRQQQQFVAAICKSSCCFGCFCCCCSFCFLKSIAEDLTRPGPRPGEFYIYTFVQDHINVKKKSAAVHILSNITGFQKEHFRA